MPHVLKLSATAALAYWLVHWIGKLQLPVQQDHLKHCSVNTEIRCWTVLTGVFLFSMPPASVFTNNILHFDPHYHVNYATILGPYRQWTWLFQNLTHLTLEWLPAHCSIHGNKIGKGSSAGSERQTGDRSRWKNHHLFPSCRRNGTRHSRSPPIWQLLQTKQSWPGHPAKAENQAQ